MTGILSAIVNPGVASALLGGGTATATAFASYARAAAHSGAGALSSTALVNARPGLSGAGTLSSKMLVNARPGLSGAGTLASPVKQIYPFPEGLDGVGALLASTKQIYPFPEGLDGSGALSAAAEGHPFVTFDAVGGGSGGSSSSQSWNHVINGTAFVCFVNNSSSSTPVVKIGTTTVPNVFAPIFSGTFSGFSSYFSAFAMINPPTGSQTINLTGISSAGAGNSASYKNVGSIGAVQSSSGSSGTATQTVTSAVGDMVAQGFCDAGTNFGTYNQTQRTNFNFGAFVNWAMKFGDAPGAASINFTAAWGGIGTYNGCAIPLIGV
jgi:hypothetical protein